MKTLTQKLRIVTVVLVFIGLMGCSYINGSKKYEGQWESDILPAGTLGYWYGERKMIVQIEENSGGNYLIKLFFDNKPDDIASMIYFFKDDCLVKNTNTLCYNKIDKNLMFTIGEEVIILKKVDVQSEEKKDDSVWKLQDYQKYYGLWEDTKHGIVYEIRANSDITCVLHTYLKENSSKEAYDTFLYSNHCLQKNNDKICFENSDDTITYHSRGMSPMKFYRK